MRTVRAFSADPKRYGVTKFVDDAVVVARVERHILFAAGIRQRADDVDGAVAVKGSDLDADDILDLHEVAARRHRAA